MHVAAAETNGGMMRAGTGALSLSNRGSMSAQPRTLLSNSLSSFNPLGTGGSSQGVSRYGRRLWPHCDSCMCCIATPCSEIMSPSREALPGANPVACLLQGSNLDGSRVPFWHEPAINEQCLHDAQRALPLCCALPAAAARDCQGLCLSPRIL